MIVPEPSRAGRTPLSWLRSRPTSITVAAMRRELKKRAWVIEQVGADRLDLSVLPPNRLAWLAQIGWRTTSQALSRLDDRRRYRAPGPSATDPSDNHHNANQSASQDP